MFGKEYECYTTPADFLEKFVNLNLVIGGLYTSASASYAELIISKSALTGQLYIWENFCVPRRMRVFLPVHVFEITADVLEDSRFRRLETFRIS